ncbi:MAG: tetratricopeptide repeat protein [Saprospiraceae bacterium]|nr:tetratricopeptide repeat protein [Lewinella sp.]
MADLAYAYRRNDADSALLIAREVLERSTRIGFSKGRAKALTAEGAALLQKAEYEVAIEKLENAVTLFASLGENGEQARSINELGLVYYQRGELALATNQFETAVKLAQISGDYDQISKCWNNLGIVQRRLGDIAEALELYRRSIQVREEHGLPPEPSTYTSIGNLYNNQRNFEVSLLYYRQALPWLEEMGNRIAYAVTLYNIGTVHEARVKFDSAMIYYQDALRIGQQLGARQINATILEAMGNVRMMESKVEDAERYFREVIQIRDSIGGDQSGQTVALLSLAKLRRSQKDWKEAQEYAEEVVNIARENNSFEDLEEAYDLLSEMKIDQDSSQRAYDFLKLKQEARDSLVTADVADQLARQKVRFEYELEIMNATSKLNEAIQRTQQYRLWGLGIGMLLVSLLVILLFVLNLQRKKTNRRLAVKNEELNGKNRELHFSNQQLETTNNKLQQFVFAASHDLRESLRSITSFSQLLRRKITPDQEDMHHYINYITNGGQRMKKILDDLLSYSRLKLEEDKQELVRTEAIIDSVLSLLEEEVSVADASIEIEGELPKLRGHRPMLEQLFFNVIENCLKYRREGQQPIIHISTFIKDDHLCFQIRDNGIGIEDAYLGHIFDPFYRVHDRLLSGSGLGLAICRRIVELYKGEIWAISEPGVGTTIYFCVPEAEVAALQENEI